MSKEYELINDLFKKNEGVAFNMVVAILMDNGYEKIKNLTDEDIVNIINSLAPELFDEDFYRNILDVARTIAKETSPYDLIKYAMVNTFLRLDDYKNVVPREKLENMVKASLSPISIMDVEYNLDTVDGIKKVCEKYDCDAEDLELLGYTIPDDYWKE